LFRKTAVHQNESEGARATVGRFPRRERARARLAGTSSDAASHLWMRQDPGLFRAPPRRGAP